MEQKTEQQIEQEKAHVEAMRNAKRNMEAALDRIATLEMALHEAMRGIKEIHENHLPEGSYRYKGDETVRQFAYKLLNNARAAL